VLTWHCGDVQRSPILPPRFPPVWETGPIVPGVYEARLRPVSLQVYEGPENAEPQIVTVRPGETTRIVFKKPQ
jgi:hypothetical protein